MAAFRNNVAVDLCMGLQDRHSFLTSRRSAKEKNSGLDLQQTILSAPVYLTRTCHELHIAHVSFQTFNQLRTGITQFLKPYFS